MKRQQRPVSKSGNFSKQSGRTFNKGPKSSKVNSKNYQDLAEDAEYAKGYAAGKLNQRIKTKNGVNDISWYAKSPQLVKDAGSFSFGIAAGTRLPVEQIYSKTQTPNAIKDYNVGDIMVPVLSFGVPGIMTFAIAPTVGLTNSQTSPINVASLMNYDNVRYKNSGAANYDNPDLTMYYVAMDSAYMYWNWLQRLYGLARNFNAENRYVPRALVEANGVDYDDLIKNLANFRMYINLSAKQLAAFCVPTTFTYMVRHSWLMTNVYMDQDTQKAQFYMFVPSWVYKYDEMTDNTGGKLVPVPITQNATFSASTAEQTNRLKVSQITQIMDDIISALLKSEDIGIISGDVLKAYGSSLYTLSEMSEDYLVTPVYNQEVLSQIENIMPVPVDEDFSVESFTIKQDPNTNQIVWDPTLTNTDLLSFDRVFINMHKNDPTPEDVMIASRLTACVTKLQDNKFKFSAVGSEWVTGIYVHTLAPSIRYTASSTTNNYLDDMLSYPESSTDLEKSRVLKLRSLYFNPYRVIHLASRRSGQIPENDIDARYALLLLSQVSTFDWKPLLRMSMLIEILDTPNRYVFSWLPMIGDLDKFAIVTSNNLEALNQVALMSLFDVPQIGV